MRLGALLINLGDPGGAASAFAESLQAGDRVGTHAPSRGMVLAGLGLAYWLMDEPFRAVDTYDDAVAALETEAVGEPDHLVSVLQARAAVLEEVHRGVDAVLDLYRAESLVEGFEPLPHAGFSGCSSRDPRSCG